MSKSSKKITTANENINNKLCSLNKCVNAYEKEIGISVEEIQNKISSLLLHRLDKDTSGILLHSSCIKCQENVKNLIKTRKTIKTYFAIIIGDVEDDKIIVNWIARDRKSGKMIIKNENDENSKKASSYIYKIENLFINNILCSKILIQIVTGRTHQIRLQLLHISRPVLGDNIYGWETENYLNASKYYKRLCLHSLMYGIHDSINKTNKYFYSKINF